MSGRVSYVLAVALLLVAVVLRLWDFPVLPSGLNQHEITDIRVTETIRSGRIEVYYNLGNNTGREGLYHTLLAAATSVSGSNPTGYRIVSFWAGMLTLALVYTLATRLYGGLAGVGALGLLAVGMWPVLLSRLAMREAVLPLLTATALVAAAAAFRVYRPRRAGRILPGTAAFAALGALLGLSLYVHPVGFLLTLATVAFVGYMLLLKQPMAKRTYNYAGFATLIFIIIATPYLISSIRLPGLSGAARILSEYSDAPTPLISAITDGLAGFFLSGDQNPAHNIPGRPLMDVVSGLLVLIGVMTALRYWRQPRFGLALTGAALLLPAALLTTASPDFRAYAALLPLVALFFGVGIKTLYAGMQHAMSRRILIVLFLTLLLFNTGWTVHHLFTVWPQRDDVEGAYRSRVARIAHYLDLTVPAVPTVVCLPGEGGVEAKPAFDLTDGQLLRLLMHRKNQPLRYVDCGMGMVFPNGGEAHQIVFPVVDGLERSNPFIRERWLSGGDLVEGGGLPPESVLRLAVADEVADIAGNTPPSGYAPEAPGGVASVMFPVRFGNNLTFLGYEPTSTTVFHPGDTVRAVAYWRADGEIPPDLRFFTHILSDPAAITAQHDTISALPAHLQPRDVFVQVTLINLPYETPAGEYDISIGAYKDTTNERLVVLDGNNPRGNRLFLDTILVERG